MQQFIGLLFSIFLLLVGHVTPVYAADTPHPEETVSQDRFDDYKELADTKLEAAKESLQKDIQNFTTRVEGQDKRIDQLGSEIDRSLTLLGVLLVLAGVISFFSFRSAARKQALDEVKAWFAEHEQSLSDRKQALTKEMDGFKQQITELQEQVHDQAKTIQGMMRELEEKLIAESDDLVKKISASRQAHDSLKTDMPQLSQSESVLLAKAANKTQHKPEAERTFTDWNRLAFAAYKNNAKEIAISNWQKATTAIDADDTKIVQALFNIGRTWGELGEYQKEIVVYDNLLQRYGDSHLPTVQERCAVALGCKGLRLGKRGDLAGAVACYDDLLVRYSQSENLAIQAHCQSTLANMVELLLVWGRNAEAIPRIHQVLARTNAASQKFAIMHFLLWLAEADTEQDDVLTAIRALSAAVEFTWHFGEIRPLVDKLPEPRKTQAECFITFFEKHHDIETLEQCLAAASN